MTTFTTEDRKSAENYKDVEFPGFSLRFTKQGNEYVCSLPDWLLDQVILMAAGIRPKK